MQHRGFDSEDRVAQVGWLRQEAQDILNYGDGDADELVDFWKSQDVEIPEWFDANDERLLRQFVAEAQ
jgi:hypothetical protein